MTLARKHPFVYTGYQPSAADMYQYALMQVIGAFFVSMQATRHVNKSEVCPRDADTSGGLTVPTQEVRYAEY